MTLRFPGSILFLKATSNINTANAQVVKSSGQVSSGKRIQTLSDDPALSSRLIKLNRENLSLDRYQETSSQAKIYVDNGASTLQNISDLIVRAKEIALSASNQTMADSDRAALADEAQGLLDQSLGLANFQVAGRYLFSGTRTSVQPYSVSSVDGQNLTAYHGNQGSLELLVQAGVFMGVTSSGPQAFQEQSRGATEFSGSTGAEPGTGADTGTNNDRLIVTHVATSFSGATGVAAGTSSAAEDTIIGPSGAYQLEVDSAGSRVRLIDNSVSPSEGNWVSYAGHATPADVQVTGPNGGLLHINTSGISGSGTVNITSTGRLSIDGGTTEVPISYGNQKVVDSVTGEVLNVNSTAIRRTGEEYVTYNGTFDLFTLLANLRDDLRNERDISAGEQIASLAKRADQLGNVQTQLLKTTAVLGGRSIRLEDGQSLLQDIQGDLRVLISSIEDVDISKAITQLQQAENTLQYSMAVSSRVLQLSFLSFLG